MLVRIPSILLLILFPCFRRTKVNALILLVVLFALIAGAYLFSQLFDIAHFIASRYLINVLPIFLISIYVSLDNLELRFEKLGRSLRLKSLFLLFFIASYLVILPFYYHTQKQDYRGLVLFLKPHFRSGDKIFDGDRMHTLGILHYFGVYPENRHYVARFTEFQGKTIGLRKEFVYRNEVFTIYYSNTCCNQYIADATIYALLLENKVQSKLLRICPVF
jgi:uncharacterized membrane protein YcgQ (UPF0703/DUF1980 family)